MIDMLKRHEIQVLRRAGHSQIATAKLAGVSHGSVRRVEREPDVTQIDSGPERERRGIGRPTKAEPFRVLVAQLLATDPDLLSVEILRRAKLAGYTGGKTALYDLVSAIRPTNHSCSATPTAARWWWGCGWVGRRNRCRVCYLPRLLGGIG